MLARIHSFVLIGIDAILCEVEVDVAKRGLEKTMVVGLAQTAVKESIERVHRAIVNSGYPFSAHKLLVNLAPADVKKEAPALDLPIAIGVLRGTNSIQTDLHKEFLLAGELALDGRLRKIKGALTLALLAKEKGFRGVILPEENAREAAYQASQINSPLDFADVRGQEAVKRAITIACAANHNLLMIGPPGTGVRGDKDAGSFRVPYRTATCANKSVSVPWRIKRVAVCRASSIAALVPCKFPAPVGAHNELHAISTSFVH